MARTMFVALVALMSAMSAAWPAKIPVARDLFPEDPSTDPFYQPPEGFEKEEPGAILKNRSVVASIFGIIPNPVEAHQLLYRTTAVNGTAISTVTTIFKTLGAPKTDRFLSFQTAYDSSASICNPSYVYQLGSSQGSLIASIEALLIEAYLLLGYIVASPDYEGPDAAFTAGRLEGMGVLDGMRAVKNYGEILGFTVNDPMIVGVGYSGGAIATGWAASLQPVYASELNIKGWVQGGTPANLTGTFLAIDGTVFSGFVPAAISGLARPSAYGAELASLFDSITTDAGRQSLEFVTENCVVSDLITFAGKSLLSTDYQTLGANLLYDPQFVKVMLQNLMGTNSTEVPKVPTFIYHASEDEIIPYANASTLVDAWCADGANLNFTTFGAGGHLTTEIIALPDVVAFVETAFAGTVGSGCSKNTEMASGLNPLALGLDLEPILIQLINALIVLGDGDSGVTSNAEVFNRKIDV